MATIIYVRERHIKMFAIKFEKVNKFNVLIIPQ